MLRDSDDAYWERQGSCLGEELDASHALVVVGSNARAVVWVALGIARLQARRRRVAVGDLLGGAEPLEHLAKREDPHGLVDSFTFGVSLNKIAVRLDEDGDLFILPSGTEAPVYQEILANPRWRRLAAGFREVGALLIIAAPAAAPGIASLVAQTDGAVVVDAPPPPSIPAESLLATVRPDKPLDTPRQSGSASRRDPRKVRLVALSTALAIVLLVAVALRSAFSTHVGKATRRSAPTATKTIFLAPPDPARHTGIVASQVTLAVPEPLNPDDSSAAAAYAVALTNANTAAGAILNLQENSRILPAATYAPVLVQGALWYRVVAGAFMEAKSADSLLSRLRNLRVLDRESGAVIRTPLAFLIDSGVMRGAVPERIASYAANGNAVYALYRTDGKARLYAGAFETAVQAAAYAGVLRAAGLTPVLVYRIGRLF